VNQWRPDPRFRYDANVSILYPGLPLMARPRAAAEDGFTAIEMWWPFPNPVPSEHEVRTLVAAISGSGTQLVALNLDAGDTAAGDRGLASRPDERDRFDANLKAAARLVDETGCRVVNVLYGNRLQGVDPARQDELAVANLASAVSVLAGVGATVVLESLNSFDSPDYPLTDPSLTVKVLDRVPSTTEPRPALLLDVYHLVRMGHDVVATIQDYAGRIGHVQLADAPGRGRPGSGDIDFAGIMAALADTGYAEYVGLEYEPNGKGPS
jgi:hydroxypyruvate isomerase